MYSSEPFPHFVDDYLAYLYEVYPGQASLDGVHLHDDLLEDLSRPAIEERVHALGGFSRRLHQIDAAHLPSVEAIEHRIVTASIESKLFDLETTRSWDRNPQVYSDALAASLAGQALFPYAPEPDRARRVVSKLRQVPRLVQAARDNIKECPGIFVKSALESWRGTLKFIESDVPRAFSALDDLHILGDLADTSTDAAAAIVAYVEYLETDLAPRAKTSFRLGRDTLEKKLKVDEGITLGAERLLAIALRELREVQEEFRSVAGRINGGDPIATWRAVKAEHPEPGRLVPAAREQFLELQEFLRRQSIVTMPEAEPVVIAASPEFCRGASPRVWIPGPFEGKASRAYSFVTDADGTLPQDRQREHMRDVNFSTLWSLSAHQTYPGHILLGQRLRHVHSKVRTSRFFAATSFVEGWAHYCEQMMMEVGFRRGEMAIKLGQLAAALAHLARFVVGIRLHCDDLSVEQGMRFFRDEAFLEEATARREAERGTFDPLYFASAAGRLMMVKLRRDYKEQQAGRFSLRAFHDVVIEQGTAPFWAHRRLLFNDTTDAVLE
jgi:uncharacterized protein (DUF885 family)